ncbi:trichohyalin-like isoform X1 [Hibiscus syriacus]|uniref:trichohyalin-like isoform X1 n=1 Tax=Hibiscus syriacus TaxID=106335 RepID=UPI001924FB70|nr:trichohyalin-like isoform X1 [Hibiscus syriacus]
MRCSSSSSSRMKNLEDAIIAELSASTSPSMAIDPELVRLRLQQLLPSFQTPVHPPYSSMIRQAILKLNEECGSTEEAMSRHIEKEHPGLPFAHASFLSHHLKKLCSEGELICVRNERYMINVDDDVIENVEKGDRALVQRGSEVEAVDGWSGVNEDRAPESENQYEVGRRSAEVDARNTACEQRMEAGRESVQSVQEGLNFSGQIKPGNQLKIFCANGDIVSGNDEQYMVQVDDGDFGNEEMNHGLNVSNSDEKEGQTLIQLSGRRVEAIDGWSGVNGDQAAESENRCEVERTEGPKEQKEVVKEPLTDAQEESQNFSGQIEVSHHLEKHMEIDCANNEHYMVQVDGGDLDKEDEEMSHRLSISDRDEKEDQTVVQVKGREVEAIDGSNGINGDQDAESENQCEVERFNVEVSSQNKTCEKIMEGFEEQNEVAEEVDAAKGMLTKVAQKRRGQKRKRQKNTKRQIKKEGFHHQLSISDRVEKKDLTLVQVVESENQREIGGHSVEVSDQNIACKQRMEELEEQNEGRKESLKEVQEERLNSSGPIEVADEVNVAVEKLTKVTRNRRGLKRKRQAKTKGQRKVLKSDDDIPQPTMEVEKKYVEEQQQQMEGGSGVTKSAGKQEQLQQCKMISEQVHPHSLKIDIRTNMLVLPCDRDVKDVKTRPKRSVRLLEKQKKEPLKHEEQQKRKLRDKRWRSFIVCALPAPQSRTNIDLNAGKRVTDSRSASLGLRESGEILLRQLKRSTPTKPRGLRGNTSKRYTQSEPKPDRVSKDLEFEKQEQKLREPEKLPEYELKTKLANFGGDKAAVSPSIKGKASMDQGNQTGLSGEILLRQLKRSTPTEPRGLWEKKSKRFSQSVPKPDGISKDVELEKQEQRQFREPKKLEKYEIKTKQAKFGGDKATVSPSIKVKASMGLSIVCALPASQSRTNINSKARMPPTDSMSASPESRESGEILLRSLKHSTPRKPRGIWRSTPKRFTQSEPKPEQANFGGEEATVSPSNKVKDPMDPGHQRDRIKVYVRRSKSQLKEPGNHSI